jgi:hypothetical protein
VSADAYLGGSKECISTLPAKGNNACKFHDAKVNFPELNMCIFERERERERERNLQLKINFSAQI